ncbi:kinase binding protein CGI-121-domain-containing protein [Schizophyllum amplum]|uniref:EKC/KEOPS complex subunit CGI121 n=1 Tax=Schizophyllum amplum TaxID=97359 RepID=A0A550CUZ1_9AGAR|nr:kinase binding protein CGI-121-domain-containing protein [Auriculariopsis ampla]
MESLAFPHVPLELSVCHMALYTGVTNAAALRKRIVAAATAEGASGDAEREAIDFAFVDARLVTSRLHLQTAVHQAVLAAARGALRTKTVHSEILFMLNPTNNISEAIRRYGVTDASTALLVVRIHGPDLLEEQIQTAADAAVAGIMRPMADLAEVSDWAAVKKYHKLNGEPAVQRLKGDVVAECRLVDNIVTSTVAAKTVLA